MDSLTMSEYNFEFKSLNDKIQELEVEMERLKQELIETDNTLYEIMNRIDSMEQSEYTFKNSLGEL
jgi:septal ring factor EnvC (AmiA/AmiB activator)